MLTNLLVILLVVILSFIFKVSEVKKYDSQLVFIILSFTVLILYKCISQYNNKCNVDPFVNDLMDNDNANMNDFINNKDNLEVELAKYKKLVNEYENKYDININQINENDIIRLENNLDTLTKNVYSDAAREITDEYIMIDNSEPDKTITLTTEDSESNTVNNISSGVENIGTETVFKALQQLLKNNSEIIVS